MGSTRSLPTCQPARWSNVTRRYPCVCVGNGWPAATISVRLATVPRLNCLAITGPMSRSSSSFVPEVGELCPTSNGRKLQQKWQILRCLHVRTWGMANGPFVFRRINGLHDLMWRMANVVASEQKLTHHRRQDFLVSLGLIKPRVPRLDRRTLREQREQATIGRRGVRAARAIQAAKARRGSLP